MKIKKLKIGNFKAYKDEEFYFDKTSIIVGKNDAGKSSILHALDLFFNPKEANKSEIFHKSGDNITDEITIECHFDISASEVKLGGEDNEILLKETNLLNTDGKFVIIQKYNAKSLEKAPYYYQREIKCYNYNIASIDGFSGKNTLEQMAKKDLDGAIKKHNIEKPLDSDSRENHWKRKVLEQYLVSIGTLKSEIFVTFEKNDDRLTTIMDSLPKFKLFSNDKQNSMNEAENKGIIEKEVKDIIKSQMQPQITAIELEMQEKMESTMKKLNITYKTLFSFLGEDDFKLNEGKGVIDFKTNGITDKKGLSIENRGSGFRRLALLSLHLSSHKEEEYKNIIFAIEEPETSQNPHNQKGIIEAMRRLVEKGSQVIITTHSPAMAKEFNDKHVKYIVIENDNEKSKSIKFNNETELFDEIIKMLGILPIDVIGKKLIVFVEGADEQILLKKINDDLIKDSEILFVSGGGGGQIKYHIALNYLEKLRMIVLVDKPKPNNEEHWREQIQASLATKYPSHNKDEYYITTSKEDITMYCKLNPEIALYYDQDGLEITEYNKNTGTEEKRLQYTKGDYNKQRKGNVSKIIRTEILNNKKSLIKDDFYDFEEIEQWFNTFDKWKKVDSIINIHVVQNKIRDEAM
jgi:predicted ATP-dependent endonuclease of OLD family